LRQANQNIAQRIMYLREVGNLLNAYRRTSNGYLVRLPDFIQELVCGSGDRRTEGLVQRLISAAITRAKGQRKTAACSTSNARILLANAVLEDCEIVAADIRNEVARGSCTSNLTVTT